MIKKLSLVAIMSLTAIPNITMANTALNSSNYSMTVEIARAKAVDNLVKRINDLEQITEKYMLSTGDINPTTDKILSYYGWDKSVFANNSKGELEVSVTNNVINIDNIFNGTKPSDSIRNKYLNNPNLNAKAVINKSNLNIQKVPLSATTIGMIDTIKQVNNTAIISKTEPSYTSKLWYIPDGQGNFTIKKYDSSTSKWREVGQGNGTNSNIVLSSKDELNSVSKIVGSKVVVSTSEGATEYVYDGTEWKALGNNGEEMFNGFSTVTDISGKLFSKLGGSKAHVNAPDGEWVGQKEFTKVSDTTGTNGWWQTSDKKYVIIDNISNLNKIFNRFFEGTIAWINDGDNVLKLHYEKINGKNQWVYIGKGYDNDISFVDKPHASNSGIYVYDTIHRQYLVMVDSNNLQSIDGAQINLIKGGRDKVNTSLVYSNNGKTYGYLTTENDCNSATCNGSVSNEYYTGLKHDNMFMYYYTAYGKRLKNLTDARPYADWNRVWSEKPISIIWNGSSFGDVNRGDVLIRTTLNGHTAYKKVKDNHIVNRVNGLDIPNNYLPAGVYPDTVRIESRSGKHYIDVNSLNYFGTDTKMPHLYPIHLNGNGINKYILKCSYPNKTTLFSDNCSNVGRSNIVITSGSRSNLSTDYNSHRLNLTHSLGNEKRFTKNGINYKYNSSWKQWFYSTMSGNTNRMVDSQPINANSGDQNIDDLVYGWNRPFMTKDGHIWKNWSDYQNVYSKKYCQLTKGLIKPPSIAAPWGSAHLQRWLPGTWLLKNSIGFQKLNEDYTFFADGSYIDGSSKRRIWGSRYKHRLSNVHFIGKTYVNCNNSGSKTWYKK